MLHIIVATGMVSGATANLNNKLSTFDKGKYKLTKTRDLKDFSILLCGQSISTLGSLTTGFALSIWILQKTGSATAFGLSLVIQFIPSIFLSPLAGIVVDRYSRKSIMLWSDVANTLGTLMVLYLIYKNLLDVWHIYVIAALAACWGTFQQLAHSATTSLLVPKEYLAKANGMMQIALQGGAIIVPLLSMLLMDKFGLQWVIFIDLMTFLFGMACLLVVKVPSVNSESLRKKRFSFQLLVDETRFGFAYIFQRYELKQLLFFLAMAGFSTGFIYVLFRPLVLIVSNPTELGMLVSIAGIGGLSGAIFMSYWGGPERKMDAVVGFTYMIGFSSILCGLGTSFVLLAVASFFFSFAIPVIQACAQTIWQSSVEREVQGRVFAAKRQVDNFVLPCAIILAPLMADYIFEPGMRDGGIFSRYLGDIIPAGDGRGIGLLFILSGLLIILHTTIYIGWNKLSKPKNVVSINNVV